MPKRRSREVVLATGPSELPVPDDAIFTGVEDQAGLFLLLCHEGSIEQLQKLLPRGIGEKTVVRAIEALNAKLPAPLAEVSADRISITPLGMALYRRFASDIQAFKSGLDALLP
jgi:hypothetical protein